MPNQMSVVYTLSVISNATYHPTWINSMCSMRSSSSSSSSSRCISSCRRLAAPAESELVDIGVSLSREVAEVTAVGRHVYSVLLSCALTIELGWAGMNTAVIGCKLERLNCNPMWLWVIKLQSVINDCSYHLFFKHTSTLTILAPCSMNGLPAGIFPPCPPWVTTCEP